MTTVIVGAGLSGLYAAMRLTERGEDVIVLEGRDRAGGRIRADQMSPTGPKFDLGPTWFWPDHQHRIPKLLAALDLETFDQWAVGDMVYEPQNGPVQLMPPQPMGPKPQRIVGSTGALVDAICALLPEGCIRFLQTVTRIEKNATSMTVKTLNDSFVADRVLLAIPPRIAAKRILYTPEFPKDVLDQMRAVPTWMAGHAKIVAVYDRPIWRERELSGHGFSHKGPIMEIHDASPQKLGTYALFGFIGVPAAQRKGQAAKIESLAVAQFTRMFGEDAKTPRSVFYKDWAEDQLTAVAEDLNPLPYHPVYAPIRVPGEWAEGLAFIGTEVAAEHGGYLEGCLEAVDAIL